MPHGVREVDTPIAASPVLLPAAMVAVWAATPVHFEIVAATDTDCGVGAALAGSPGVMLTTRLPLVSIGTSGAIGPEGHAATPCAATLNAVGATEPYAPFASVRFHVMPHEHALVDAQAPACAVKVIVAGPVLRSAPDPAMVNFWAPAHWLTAPL